jgi:diaminohydroxyphosphoribosylaminopyrimidine deaminase / 5-amino-6-(5-phosphoribosylamino)uracil reductase
VSAPIDEGTAWNLVRAIRPGLAGGGGLIRVSHDLRPDAWLQVDPSGRWQVPVPVTAEAQQVLDLYLPLQIPADLVIAQFGQSLDGRIATRSGHSHYVTGPADLRRLHRLRALVDAVIVGCGTVTADNPRLTVRLIDGTNPARIVLDPEGRLDRSYHLFTDGAARTLVVRRGDAGLDRPLARGDVISMPVAGADGFDPQLLIHALRDQGYRRVLVEGGGITVSRFLKAGVVDRLHVTVAPLLIGSGRPGLMLEPIDSLDLALRPACRHFQLGSDMLFDLDMRDMRNEPHTSPS